MCFRFMQHLTFLPRQPSNFIHIMKYVFITLFAVLSAMSFTYGQSTEKTLNSSLPAKWEIGIDVLPLIKMNHLPQNTLFFRRNYAINDRTCKAFRFRVGVDAEDKYVKIPFDNGVLADNRTYSPYLALGHEWKFLYNKYRWYIGAEVSGQLTHTNISSYSPMFGLPFYEDQKIRNQSIASNGILGLQYAIGKKLFVLVESSVEVQYHHEQVNTVKKDVNGTIDSYSSEKRAALTSKIIPIFSLGLNYSLQKKQYNAKK